MKPGDLVRIPVNINGDPEMIGLVISMYSTTAYDEFDGEHVIDCAQILIGNSVIDNYTPWSLEVL